VEFVTPLAGGEFRRDGTRDVTTSVNGCPRRSCVTWSAVIAPWSVSSDAIAAPMMVLIANPVSYQSFRSSDSVATERSNVPRTVLERSRHAGTVGRSSRNLAGGYESTQWRPSSEQVSQPKCVKPAIGFL